MTTGDNEFTREVAANDDAEEIFYHGLTLWEKYEDDLEAGCSCKSDFEKAKELIGEAKQNGYQLADICWDIICSFEEAADEGVYS